MLPQALCVGLIILQLTGSLEAKLRYAVIFPSEIRISHHETVCVHLVGADEPGRMQLTLPMNNTNITLLEISFQKDPVFTCTSFQVPPVSTGSTQVAALQVTIESPGEQIIKTRKVLLRRERSSILIQTDKAVYKPGQTVKFRVISLKGNLKPKNIPIPVIELKDPGKNRIGQWLNVTPQQGIADLSLPLSSEPQLGEYCIKVKNHVHTFSVEEYVLPKFEVSLQFPKRVLYSDEHIPIKLCGRYTYGKPVQGTFTCKVCQKHNYRYHWRIIGETVTENCVSFNGKLDKSGCYEEELKLDSFKMLDPRLHKELLGEASVTEDGTGIQMSTSSKASIRGQIFKASFVDADTVYRPGIPYRGTVKVVDASGDPIANMLVHLIVKIDYNTIIINQTLETKENGQASFKLDNTDHWENNVDLEVKITLEPKKTHHRLEIPQKIDGYLRLSPFHSQSKSFLKVHSVPRTLPCEGEQDIQLDYIIQHKQLKVEMEQIQLHYLVVSKARIQDSGSLKLAINTESEVLRGEVSIKVQLSAKVSPMFQVLSYIFLPSGEIVGGSAGFKVLQCFNNQVSVGFSPDEVLPGSDVSLGVRAAAGSLCALRVVDQSVVLMKPEKELTAENVHDLFVFNDYGGYDHQIKDPVQDTCGEHDYGSRSYYIDSSVYKESKNSLHDVYSLFEAMSLKIITSSDIRKSVDCHIGIKEITINDNIVFKLQRHKHFLLHKTLLVGQAGPIGIEPDIMDNVIVSETPKETPRVYFPETWIWELTAVSTSGHVNLPVTVPDTITDWTGGAFCMGPSGFGISSPTTLRAFQPFFVELALPYSVVRGETFTLKASVFNYLKECIKVQTSLLPSLELEEEPCATCQYQSCLCADERRTFYWNLTATNLGEVNITVRTEALNTQDLCNNEEPVVPKQGSIDTVIKPLLVKPGGVLEEKSHSSLLCRQVGEDSSISEEISLNVPDNILKDSERAHVTVLGDLMGTAMQNLDSLLAMPYGCGEQNMVLFAPNIFIMEYLEKTEQLNSEIQSKATNFLQSGYQRQLTYKRDDGSYSAFGKKDPEGNTWLSAFVVKSFSKARPYIFIDETHLKDTYSWLQKNRKEDGCFRSVGRLFNNAMKGGVDDEVSLSAYVTIALLESGHSMKDSIVGDAVSCLRKAAQGVTSVYTQALLSYTFTLCEETELRQKLLDQLQEKAVRRDGQLHWERQSTDSQSDLPFWYRASSVDVEMTAYVLLSLLSGPHRELGMATEVVNWLSKQQNPYGGFSSTQDTVVALQALAKYAEVTYNQKAVMSVTVQSKTGFLEQFHVDKTNRLLQQRAKLPNIPGQYTVAATGSGCVYVQTVLRYNVPPPRSDATFEVRVDTDPKECPPSPATKLKIQITARYTGSRDRSNMALIEVKMLSGFIPVKSSVKELEKAKLIQRSEIQTDQVTLYLDELGHTASVFSITVEQESLVKNLKPATVKVYDYYETGEFAIAEYNSPCSSDENNSR